MAENKNSRLNLETLWEYDILIAWITGVVTLVIVIGPSTIFWFGLMVILLLILYAVYYLCTGEFSGRR